MRATDGTRALGVSLNGQPVARWSVRGGRHELDHEPAWLDAAAVRPLSLSLPLLPDGASHRGAAVERWFENLLPDDPTRRERMRRRFGARNSATFDLLAEVGRDRVGAVQLLEPGVAPEPPSPATGTPLVEAEVAELLRNASLGSVPGRHDEDGFRLSLAGAQASLVTPRSAASAAP